MSRQSGDHPPPEQLPAFGLGLLAPDQTADIESHVAECQACCQALLSVPDDSLVSRLREAVSTSSDGLAAHATLTAISIANGLAPGPSEGPSPLPPELESHPRYRVEKLLGAGGMGAGSRGRIARLPIADSLLPTPDCLLPTPVTIKLCVIAGAVDGKGAALLDQPAQVGPLDVFHHQACPTWPSLPMADSRNSLLFPLTYIGSRVPCRN